MNFRLSVLKVGFTIRIVIFCFACILILTCKAQVIKSDSTYIRFFSEAPIEDIAAVNRDATSTLNLDDQSITIVVPIEAFDFKRSLMKKHFNNNYMESEDFPLAKFEGKLIGWDGVKGKSQARAKGTMEIHGVQKAIELKGIIERSSNSMKLIASFPIRMEDYDVKIPKTVFYTAADEVEVTVRLAFTVPED